MTPKKSPSASAGALPKKGGIRLEPLQGRFFDIKPARKGGNSHRLNGHNDFFRFTMVAVVAFLVLSLGNAYVLGREIIFESQEAAYEGYENIRGGIESLLSRDAVTAKNYFLRAESDFKRLSQAAEPITSQSTRFMPEGLYVDTAGKLIESALEVAGIGQELADLMIGFAEIPQTVLAMAGGADGGLIESLLTHKASFDKILSLSASLQRKMAAVNDRILPEDLRNKIVTARLQIGRMMAVLLEADDHFGVALRLLGDRVPHRYLVLLQNNHERRATGGFIGSYLIVDVNDGKIVKMEAKDVYETDGQLKDVIKTPPGIDRVADRLYMRDANYSPDFPTSARSIMWFLEHSKGPSVDTVIAIDQTVVEKMLELTGPLILPNFPFQINAGNFSQLISFYTETKLSDSATPKQLLFDLIPAFQSQFANVTELEKLFETGKELAVKGHVQAYSSDSGIQDLIERTGLSGAMIQAEEKTDYLSVITTSIGGNKSDEYIKTNLYHRSIIGREGNIENELTIKKTHQWNKSADTNLANLIERYGTGKLSKEAAYFILGRGPNVDYMRIYVPQGSTLQTASGIKLSEVEVSEELGYTVFGFVYGPVNAGSSKEITIRYLLPFSLSAGADEYRFSAWRQAGAKNVILKKEILSQESSDAFSLTLIPEAVFDRYQTVLSDLRPAVN